MIPLVYGISSPIWISFLIQFGHPCSQSLKFLLILIHWFPQLGKLENVWQVLVLAWDGNGTALDAAKGLVFMSKIHTRDGRDLVELLTLMDGACSYYHANGYSLIQMLVSRNDCR